MALKKYKPTTPGQRQLVLVSRTHLHKGGPVKALTEGQHRHGGRNNTGRVTVRWQGGGHKQRYRIIDFKRRKFDMPAVIERIEYDPNRTPFIALVKYKDGELAYILAPQRVAVGDTVISGEKVDVKPGNAMPLSAMPVEYLTPTIEDRAGEVQADGPSISQGIEDLERRHPGIRERLLDEKGDIRRFVNIYLNGDDIRFLESPSPLNPLGVKGCGEGSTVPAAAVVISAVEDALAPFGVTIREAPITPPRLVALIEAAKAGKA